MRRARMVPVLALALVVIIIAGGVAVFSSQQARFAASESPAFMRINQGLDGGSGASAPAAQPVGDATALETGGAPQAAGGPAQTDQQAFQRLVIKTANLSLQVERARDAEANVRAIVAKLGGYVVKVETNGADENISSTITFRVPAERFDEALAGVQGLATKVFSRTVSGDDVTEEFVDLDSRLKNLEATRERLQAFLDKAATVEDALKVNQSLSDIQGQIEQIRGRQQYLKLSAALSTITVTLSPVPPAAPLVAEEGWQPLAVAREALRGLIGFGQGLASVAIVLLVWAPVWLPLALLGLWLRRRYLRRGARQRATAAD